MYKEYFECLKIELLGEVMTLEELLDNLGFDIIDFSESDLENMIKKERVSINYEGIEYIIKFAVDYKCNDILYSNITVNEITYLEN